MNGMVLIESKTERLTVVPVIVSASVFSHSHLLRAPLLRRPRPLLADEPPPGAGAAVAVPAAVEEQVAKGLHAAHATLHLRAGLART